MAEYSPHLKEAENLLDVTSVMLAREQAKLEAKKPMKEEEESPVKRTNLKSFVTGMIAEKKAALVNKPVFRLEIIEDFIVHIYFSSASFPQPTSRCSCLRSARPWDARLRMMIA